MQGWKQMEIVTMQSKKTSQHVPKLNISKYLM